MKVIFWLLIGLTAVVTFLFVKNRKDNLSVSRHDKVAWYETSDEVYRTTFQAGYTSDEGDEEDPNIQCPIPMKDRVRNYTGTQCVFSSIEMLGRWAEEPKLTNPPITSDPQCSSYSGPDHAARQLRRLGVKFEQTWQDKEAGLRLIRKAMSEGRGCLFDVPGHAMVLVHFDEVNNVVKWVDNSDYSLKIQTMSIRNFMNRWGGWVLVVYADNDIVPQKLGRNESFWRSLPIFNPANPTQQYDPNHLPKPSSMAIQLFGKG